MSSYINFNGQNKTLHVGICRDSESPDSERIRTPICLANQIQNCRCLFVFRFLSCFIIDVLSIIVFSFIKGQK